MQEAKIIQLYRKKLFLVYFFFLLDNDQETEGDVEVRDQWRAAEAPKVIRCNIEESGLL